MTPSEATGRSAASVGARTTSSTGRGTAVALKPRDKRALRRAANALEVRLLHRSDGPGKILIQAELGYMRRQLLADRKSVDVTYPVNPPYAFVHIFFNPKVNELLYQALEPTIKPKEQALIAQIRGRMESIISRRNCPSRRANPLRTHRYLRNSSGNAS